MHHKDHPEDKAILEITDEDLIKRYGEVKAPTPMMIRDQACSKGLFGWSSYTDLIYRRWNPRKET